MARNFAVEELPDAQFQFVIDAILDGYTNREICAAFEAEWGETLARTSLQRWREAAGDELAERYRLARYQARKLQEDLGEKDRDKYAVVIDNIEDRLLAGVREVSKLDPFKLILVKQEEERRKLRAQELEIKRAQLELEKLKVQGAQPNLPEVGLKIIGELLDYLSVDPEGYAFFKRHAKPFHHFLIAKHAPAQAQTN
jgi:hypothetical protein